MRLLTDVLSWGCFSVNSFLTLLLAWLVAYITLPYMPAAASPVDRKQMSKEPVQEKGSEGAQLPEKAVAVFALLRDGTRGGGSSQRSVTFTASRPEGFLPFALRKRLPEEDA